MVPGMKETMSESREGLKRLFAVRRGETGAVVLAMACFCCLLIALMVLRPARDALGMQRGIETVRWLFIGTALMTLAVNPLFAWLVSRFARITFVSATYLFFALCLGGFYALLGFAPAAVGQASGAVFYVWFSVANLFVTMVFWALMADRFRFEQAKRLFPLIALGGTIGALIGPLLAGWLAGPLGTPALLLVSIVFLLAGLGLAWAFMWRTDSTSPGTAQADDVRAPPIGGSAWEGFSAVFQSRYLSGVSAYIVVMTVMATFIYFTRLQLVATLGTDIDLRTRLFAHIDLATQATTLLLQALVAGRLMQRFGVHIVLAVLPVLAALGFIGLALTASLAMLIVFEASFRAVQRALARPARETLYTVLGRSDKYKAKAFIDTFIYRTGDVLGAQIEGLMGRFGLALGGLATLAIPLALSWAVLGLWLGREQQRLAARSPDADTQTATTTGNVP